MAYAAYHRRQLTEKQIVSLRDYLAAKWGIA